MKIALIGFGKMGREIDSITTSIWMLSFPEDDALTIRTSLLAAQVHPALDSRHSAISAGMFSEDRSKPITICRLLRERTSQKT